MGFKIRVHIHAATCGCREIFYCSHCQNRIHSFIAFNRSESETPGKFLVISVSQCGVQRLIMNSPIHCICLLSSCSRAEFNSLGVVMIVYGHFSGSTKPHLLQCVMTMSFD